ncbi:hypothetical protein DFJ43DRAFT_978408, partial [Lentinula guzmanii]
EAGPSRLQISTNLLEPFIHTENADDDDHEQDTPKLPSAAALPTEPLSTYPEDTPAARLKAVLERTSAKYKPPPVPIPIPSSGSAIDFESDFDIPTIGSSQPSLARENLNSLFSNALREPGDTPQKSVKGKMRRRNSIDTSEFESSPRVAKVNNNRAGEKGKRRSMSDDELSSSNTIASRKLDSQLRLTLTVGNKSLSNQILELIVLVAHESLDNLKFPKELDSSQLTPPAATSTPQHSWFKSQFQSNLLDADSEMQQAMRDLDSYEHSL